MQHHLVGFVLTASSLFGTDEVVVLCRHNDGVDSLRDALVAVFHRHLTLGVGTQVGHFAPFLSDVGQRAHEQMGQVERHGHVVLGLVHGIAEHHTLVAGTLFLLIGAVDTAVDVVALLVDGTHYAAGVAVELILALGVADAVDGLAGQRLQVYILFALHLTGNDDLSCRHQSLHSHAGMRVVG